MGDAGLVGPFGFVTADFKNLFAIFKSKIESGSVPSVYLVGVGVSNQEARQVVADMKVVGDFIASIGLSKVIGSHS